MSAPRFDNSNAATTNTTVLSYTLTIAAGANFLVIGIGVFASSVTGVTVLTVDGVDILPDDIIQEQRTIPTTTKRVGAGLWRMANPPTGTVTIDIEIDALTADPRIVSGAESYFDVELSNPIGDFGSAKAEGTTPTVTIDTAGGDDVAVDCLAIYRAATSPTATVGADQVELWNLQVGASTLGVRSCGSYENASSSSTTMSWTLSAGTTWVIVAAAIRGSGARLLAQVGVGT